MILLFGVGFFSPDSKLDSTPVNNFIAAATVDSLMSGGGDNTVKSPPALATAPPEPPQDQVAPPQPLPPPVAQPKPQPAPPLEKIESPAPREIPKETKTVKSDVPAVDAKPRPRKIEVNTQIVTTSDADVKAARDAARKATAAAEKRRAEAISRAVAGIRGGVSGSTEVKLAGPGGGGIPYGNFLSAVHTVYYNAWNQPENVPDVTAKVSVVIARDGSVISARIVSASGNSTVDRSVQDTIDRVRFAAPLPEGAKEDQRTVIVNFNTQATTTG
ncbi:MAG TPA: energy transducer TonB [Verrucomicrobiae bacterium]|nr:energy transducer TonB [Verrucomicrobiae bacterium]